MREQVRVVLAVARDPALARIELAYLGFNMAEFALWMTFIVYAYGVGGAGTAALVVTLQLIPCGLIAPFAGYAGDRYRGDRVLLGGYLIQATTGAATAIAMLGGAPFIVVALIATTSAISFTLTRPVQAVVLPGVTHSPADLTAANTVSGLAENVGTFVGPLLAGIILAAQGPGVVFGVFAVVCALSAGLVTRLPVDLRRVRIESGEGARAVVVEAFGGFGVLRRQRQVALLVTILATSSVVIGALDILFAAVAIDLLHAGEAWAGFLYSGFGLGGIFGTLATVSLVGRRRMTPAFASSSGLFGFSISAIGLIPTTVSAPLLFGASGAGFSVTMVAGRTLLQRTAPESVLARVFGILESLDMAALAVGTIGAGALIQVFGVAAALFVVGLLVPAVIAVSWVQLGAVDRNARVPDPETLELLRRLPIFAPLSAPTMERVVDGSVRVDVPLGDVVIREGDVGDRYYVIAEGRVEATADGAHLSFRDVGQGFGEIALLRNVPRTATITALTPLRLIALDRDHFLEAVTGHPQSRERAESVAAEQLANTPDRG